MRWWDSIGSRRRRPTRVGIAATCTCRLPWRTPCVSLRLSGCRGPCRFWRGTGARARTPQLVRDPPRHHDDSRAEPDDSTGHAHELPDHRRRNTLRHRSGAGDAAEAAHLERQIDRLIEIGGRVEAILSTHSHPDHTCSADALRQRYAVPILRIQPWLRRSRSRSTARSTTAKCS